MTEMAMQMVTVIQTLKNSLTDHTRVKNVLRMIHNPEVSAVFGR
jgi:hypothetical protein